MKNTTNNNEARAAVAAYLAKNGAVNFWVCGGEVWHRVGDRASVKVAEFGGDDGHLAAMVALRELRA